MKLEFTAQNPKNVKKNPNLLDKITRQEYIEDGLKTLNYLFNRFVTSHRLFQYMSKEELEDMKQDAVIEMINTIDKFEPERGLMLTTYITPRIIGFFKDFLKQRARICVINMDITTVSPNCLAYEPLFNEQIIAYFNELNLSETDIKNIWFNITDQLATYQILNAISTLPDNKIYLLLSYYIYHKKIQDIVKDLGFKSSGWVYRMKRDAIKHLRKQLAKE